MMEDILKDDCKRSEDLKDCIKKFGMPTNEELASVEDQVDKMNMKTVMMFISTIVRKYPKEVGSAMGMQLQYCYSEIKSANEVMKDIMDHLEELAKDMPKEDE